jgi:hypothetical protein
MTRAWLAIFLIALTLAAAKAMPVNQQIIIFGSQSAASGSGGGGGGGGSCTGTIVLSTGCTQPMLGGL